MENPQKPWKVEYAKSSRSSCRTCKTPIEKEVLRVGKMVQSKQFDGLMPMWSHADCLLKKANQIKSIGDIEGIEALRWNDQQKITKYIESCGQTDETPAKAPGKSSGKAAATTEHGVEVSKTSRASCKKCSEKIMKGEVRLSSKPEGQGPRGLVWHHAQCFMDLFPSVQVEKVSGWTSLTTSDQESVLSLIKGKAPLSGVEEPSQKSNTKVAGKRKTDATNGQGIKIAKVEPDHAVSKCVSKKDTELERKLEAQTKELWGLKDQLKKHVSTAELRLMLEANDQDSTGSELVLRDNCADGMLFGALEKCPMCSGHLRCSGGKYRCHGWLSEWSKCTYSTAQPERVKGNWEIPEGSENAYLLKWFKGQKATKPARVVPLSCDMTCGSPVANGRTQSVKEEKLGDLKVAFTKLAKDSVKEFKSQIEGAGGQVHAKIKKETNCLIVGEVDEPDAEMRKARRMKIPIVREEYIKDCVAKQKKLPFDRYKVESDGESASMATVKVKGRSAVHESSGLQDSGHILEVGNNIYNTTLNMSDLSTGVNSYYILQIIEEDKGSDCYVFRKWGRVGNDSIGSFKLEEMTKSDAIEEFERLFFEKTGNYWEDWVNRTSIQKHRGKYFPLDIDYGASKQQSTRKINNDDTKLAPALAELIKMLFNVEAYRAAMMEFEINLSEMPLGKLSRSNIQQGYEALTQLQNLFSDQTLDASIRENFIVDASNRFFTMIPSVHPHVIKDEDDFKSKVKMLDALQEIEIASRLVGFDADSDDTLDEKYKKLHCDINPLPHDSEEYQLIEKYLRRTHAPTHTEWGLELEEVFALEREGESDKFAPQREKLGNRMLLWHGSRLTNFVGILSQGLRIAPPEAPATGYMFGKGVYFADLVSKSAQYCFTDKKSPVGLMVLSEVALGEMYELKKSKYMDKPPRGKHSTKGLGKKVPLESEYVKWKDDVVVPCGKPVDSKVRSSELMYNEYIVYDTAQVKMQFLLKVRFHHKR